MIESQYLSVNLSSLFSLTIMMTITPMMQYIQDRILEAVHWCTLEEAREREYKCVWWLIINVKKKIKWRWVKSDRIVTVNPPTLIRTLTALGDYYWLFDWRIIGQTKEICVRKLLNEDKSEASLFDQTPETQLAIWVLLGRKENQIN